MPLGCALELYAAVSLLIGAAAAAALTERDDPFWRFLVRLIGWAIGWPIALVAALIGTVWCLWVLRDFDQDPHW